MTPASPEGRIDEVLGQQAWLVRLARRLGQDEAAAEDVVQDVLVSAMGRPLRQEGALRAWLRTVLVRRARTGATAERHRREREERSARPEALPAADAIAERLELARNVAAALDELPDGERRALYLRYYEDLSPPEIARALGAPLGTIKSRLAMGRERLRRRLDREYGQRGTWAALLLPLAAARPAPIEPASAAAGIAAASGPLLLGTVTMTTKATLALAAGAAIVASLFVWKPWAPAASAKAVAPEHGESPPIAEIGSLRAPLSAAGEAELPSRVELEAGAPASASSSTSGRVEISATFASDGAPAALLGGSLAPEHLAWKEYGGPPIRRFQLDLEGRCAVSDLGPGVWFARLNGREVDGGLFEVAAGATGHVALAILPGIEVRGRVLDPQESPVPGAEVFSSWSGDLPGHGTLAIADAAGRFALRDLAPWTQTGPYTAIAARARGHRVSREWEATGRAGDVQEVVLRLGGQAGSLRGRVIDPDGQPVAGAVLEFPSSAWPQEVGLSQEGLRFQELPDLELETGLDGTFACDRLPPGQVQLSVESEANPTWQGSALIEAGRTTELEVELDRGGALEGVVLDPNGKPVEGARILAGWPGRLASQPSRSAVVGWTGSGEPRKARTDAAGRYRIEGLQPGPCEVHASLQFGREVQAEVEIAAGETTSWEVQLLPSQRAAGKLEDESGAPLANWAVHVIEPSRTGLWLVSTRTDAAGRFALENCPEGRKAIEVCLPETFAAPPMLVVPFPQDGRELTLVVPDRARPSATLAGRFVDPSGADVESIEVWLNAADFNWGKQILPDRTTQAFQFGPLVAGSYHLSVRAAGYVEPRLEISDLAPGEFRDLGAIELARGARLAIDFVAAMEGASSDGAMLQLARSDGLRTPDVVEGSSWRSYQLPPGEWTVRAAGPSMATCETTVTLVSGETASLELAIQPGVARHVVIEPGDAGDAFELEVLDAHGKPYPTTMARLGAQAVIHGLTVGTWRVVARHPDGRKGELELAIPVLEQQPQPLTLVVR